MSFNLEFDYRLTQEHSNPELVNLLKGWHKAMERYTELQKNDEGTQDDVAYWYGERANLSFLAAGAWLSGFAALEEFRSEKIRAQKKKSNGRVDLFICKKGVAAEIEAKQRYINASAKSSLEKIIKRTMESAKRDAKATTGSELKIACGFFVPYFKVKDRNHRNFRKIGSEVIRKHLDRYIANKDVSWAWSFPECGRTLKETDRGIASYMPGVVLGLDLFWT
jgi:hypothetical protein